MPRITPRISFAVKISVAYALCASLWIVVSSTALSRFIRDAATLADFDIYKDVGFVVVTALLLFLLLKYRRDAATEDDASVASPPHTRRLLIAFAAGTAVALAIGHFSFHHVSGQFKIKAQQDLAAIADLKVRQVESWLAERKSYAQSLAAATHLASDIAGAEKDRAGAFGKQKQLAQRLDWLRELLQVDGLTLFDRDRKVVVESGWKNVAEDYHAGTINKTLVTGAAGFVDLHREVDGREERVAVEYIAPLIDSEAGPNQAVGVLLMRIDPHRYLFPLLESWPVPSDTAESFLVRRERDDAVYLSTLRYRTDAPIKFRIPLANSTVPAVRGILQGNGVYEGIDYRNVAVLSATRTVAGTPWVLVAKIDQREVYEDIYRTATLFVILTLIAIAIGALLVTLLWRQQQAFYRLKMHEVQARSTALTQHFSTLANSINDITLLLDDEGRVLNANDRAAAAYGYSHDELLKLTAAKLHAEGATPSLAERLREIGARGSLAYETTHRRKDGSVFPVEVSARKIEADGHGFIQAIIRDVSERKAAEREIRDLNRLYATLSAANRAIVHATTPDHLFNEICNAAVAHGQFAGASVGMLDAATQRIVRMAMSESVRDSFFAQVSPSADPSIPEGRGPSGIALRGGQAYFCNDFLADPATAPWHDRAAQAGIRASAAVPLKVAGQAVGTFNLYARETNFFSAPIRALVEEIGSDIAFALENFEHEKLRLSVERALGESEAKFRGLVEQSIVGIFILSDNAIRYVNPRAAEIIGYTPDEIVGRSIFDFVPAAIQKPLADHVENLLSRRAHSLQYEFALIHKQGQLVDVGTHATLASYEGNPAIIGVVQDVSERKKAEEAAQQYLRQLEKSMFGTIDAVSTMIQLRDPYTSGHERRVGEIAAAIGNEMGLGEQDIKGLRVTGYVHDIGKIACPAEILSKPSRLTTLEFEMIKTHAQQGYDILKSVDFPWPVAQTILQHHERLDGSGYPRGLKGDAISLPARIIAVADTVEAMATHRPYRPALGLDAALREIEHNSGIRYDAQVVAACLRLFREKNYQLSA